MRSKMAAGALGAVVTSTVTALILSATAAWAVPPRGGGIDHPGTPVTSGPVSAGGPSPGVGAAAFANKGVLAYGDAPFEGSPTNVRVNAPIVGMASAPSGSGYWLVAADGGIFTYGDAGFYGSAGNIDLNAPIVGMAATPDGHGYWLVAADGGIFTYGDTGFYGSAGNIDLNAPIVGMAATPDGHGYWLAAADGGIFTYGDAPFEGSEGNVAISASVAGIATTPSGQGYWLAGSGGAVYPFGDAVSYGDNAATRPEPPISGITGSPDGKGYWLLEPDAFPTGFTHPAGGSPIVATAASQIQADPDAAYGRFCNPYGPCEEWCALFATWAWQSAGVPIPRYAFVGDIYHWAAAHTAVLAPNQDPQPGDLVLYGTGPATVYTAVHVAVVAQRWRDGFIDTIDGDSGPGPSGYYSVTFNGPYLPSHSLQYNGFGIFAFAVP